MKFIALALLFCAPLGAQSLIFLIDNSDGATPTSQLPVLSSPYMFPDTPVGGTSSIVIRVWNPSTTSVTLGIVFVGAAAGSPAANSNFTITGLYQKAIIAPQASTPFTLSFTPQGSGPLPGYLQALENGTIASVATLQGTATPAQLTLTCSGAPTQCNGSGLQSNSPTPLDFGNVSTIGSSSVTLTLHNLTSATVSTPDVALPSELSASSSAFTLDKSTLSSTIDPNSSASFTVTFAPAEGGPPQAPVLFQGTLEVCLNLAGCPKNNTNDYSNYSSYPVAGAGIVSVLGDISSLAISCVDQTGVDCSLQGRSINLVQIAAGTTLTFQVRNPQTTINPVTINYVNTPAGFNLSSTWAGLPSCPAATLVPATLQLMAATLQPGQCISFQLVFSGYVPGPYDKTLAIDARQFQITGIVPQPVGAPGSALSGIQLICGTSPCTGRTFTSQEQVPLTVQLDSAASVESIFALGMTFAPSVPGVSDDAAIKLIAPISGRTVNMKMSIGSKTGTYNGQSQLTLQTGTTAGTITFTLTYLEQPITLATITIPPERVKIVSTLAQRQAPNLVVTVGGYDNTYSVGQLAFTFYDTSGRVLTSSPFQASVVASDFHQYFFGPEDLGGAFSVQASFPMSTGDVTQVGSVAVTVTNSIGSTTTPTQTFQ